MSDFISRKCNYLTNLERKRLNSNHQNIDDICKYYSIVSRLLSVFVVTGFALFVQYLAKCQTKYTKTLLKPVTSRQKQID